ncbi:MAG: thioredoxin fold domain-containing protein [Muribaculaceae bacterium]|nr:thioredoxin fold domain-containing protein [Muribaculaceae bacterium]
MKKFFFLVFISLIIFSCSDKHEEEFILDQSIEISAEDESEKETDTNEEIEEDEALGEGDIIEDSDGNSTGEDTNNTGEDTNDPNEENNAESVSFEIVDCRFVPLDGKPIIVKFFATWCSYCKQLAPIYEELAEEYGSVANFTEVDVDINPEIANEYGVTGLPTLVFIDSEAMVKTIIKGIRTKADIELQIIRYFGYPS